MHIARLESIEKTVPEMPGAKGVQKQVPISSADGTPAISFRVFTIEPGGHTPFHQHPFEHINYVIRGEAILVSESGEHELKEGNFALILPDEKHQFRNNSKDQELLLVCAVPKEYE